MILKEALAGVGIDWNNTMAWRHPMNDEYILGNIMKCIKQGNKVFHNFQCFQHEGDFINDGWIVSLLGRKNGKDAILIDVYKLTNPTPFTTQKATCYYDTKKYPGKNVRTFFFDLQPLKLKLPPIITKWYDPKDWVMYGGEAKSLPAITNAQLTYTEKEALKAIRP